MAAEASAAAAAAAATEKAAAEAARPLPPGPKMPTQALWPYKTLEEHEEHNRLGLMKEELQQAAWRRIASKLRERRAQEEQSDFALHLSFGFRTLGFRAELDGYFQQRCSDVSVSDGISF